MKKPRQTCVILLWLLGFCHPTQGGVIRGKNTEGEGCIVYENHDLRAPYSGTVLTYITPEQSLNLLVTFKDHNMDERRDVMVFSNGAANHIKVREGHKHSSVNHTFSTKMPEGWVTLRLTASEKCVSLFWVDGQEEKSLVSLPVDSAPEKLLLNGHFSTCSGDSPEWQVNENEEVTVLLDCQSPEQELEMTGDSSTEAFLKFSERHVDVPANTTLGIKTLRRDSESTVDVFFKGSAKDSHVTEQLPSSWPAVVIGGRRGSTHLRLKRFVSSPSLPSPSPTTSIYFVSTIVLAALLGVATIVILTAVGIYVTREMKKRREKPDEGDDADEMSARSEATVLRRDVESGVKIPSPTLERKLLGSSSAPKIKRSHTTPHKVTPHHMNI